MDAHACSVSDSSKVINQPLNSDLIFAEEIFISFPKQQQENLLTESAKPVTTAEGEIYPARCLIMGESGNIILTTYPIDQVQRIPHSSSNCHNS